MIGLPHNSVNVVPIAVQRRNILLSRRYFAVQLERYRDVHFQAAPINRPAAVHLIEVTSAYSSRYVQ